MRLVAAYKGKLYVAGFAGNSMVNLYSDDISEEKNGFIISNKISKEFWGEKIVSKEELDEFYAISKTAVYKGVECAVFSEDMKGNFYLSTGLCRYGQPLDTKENIDKYLKFGFKVTNDFFENYVSPDECDEVCEVREDYIEPKKRK